MTLLKHSAGLAVDLLSSSSDGVPLPAGTCNELLADLRALSDVTFVVEDEKFYCHRVFMLRCEYFKVLHKLSTLVDTQLTSCRRQCCVVASVRRLMRR